MKVYARLTSRGAKEENSLTLLLKWRALVAAAIKGFVGRYRLILSDCFVRDNVASIAQSSIILFY